MNASNYKLFARDLQLLVYLNQSEYGNYFNTTHDYDVVLGTFSTLGPEGYRIEFDDIHINDDIPINVVFRTFV